LESYGENEIMAEFVNINDNKFQNEICQECIKRNVKKYGSFQCQCEGITVETDVKLAIAEGYSEEEARWMFDPVYFFETIYGSKVRWYQARILYCTSKRLAGRQCRQTGKTLMFMYRIFHYCMTNENIKVLVIAPTEKQIEETWQKYVFRDFIHKSGDIKASISGTRKSPSYQVEFCNGSILTFSIANDSCRGFTGEILYIDEAALVPAETLNSIIMTIAAAGSRGAIMYTSTPKGKGNMFYKACKSSPDTNEYHVSIHEVEEMAGQIESFKALLGETGFIQECEAEFPDTSGGPFNFRGVDLAKQDYRYEDCGRRPGFIYVGGVDWNGSGIGTYFRIMEFDPSNYIFKVVDKQVISSANWNGLAAKEMLKHLNDKWKINHWMCDSGYGHDLMEDLKLQSMRAQNGTSLAKIKHTLFPVEFGSWTVLEDPFSKEEIKKSTKAFIVSQVARLFEPMNGRVSVVYSKYDESLTTSLENYKILNISDKGNVQYGFDKKDGIEDHDLDSFMLSIYGIVKNYNELFKRVFLMSVMLEGREILTPKDESKMVNYPYGSTKTLLTDNHNFSIKYDDKPGKYEPKQENVSFISRTFSSAGVSNSRPISGINNFRRTHSIIKRNR
jgi:hypothetical protein